MAYEVPGRADRLSTELTDRWNLLIAQQYERLASQWGSRFFVPDPGALTGTTTRSPITWFADPAEPNFCLGQEVAEQLSDWASRGVIPWTTSTAST